MPGESTPHPVGSPRRLVAILAADIAGYSRLMGSDEEGTLARMKRHRREIVEPTLQEHYGRIVKTTGDGFLAIFDSPLEAVRAAIVIQQSMAARNTALPRGQWIRYRMGVNLGDVILDEDDVYGEGVNIAARLETLAEPGGVYISGGVYEQIKHKLVCGYQSLGDEKLKNITDPVRIYRVLPDPAAVTRAKGHRLKGAAMVLSGAMVFFGIGWYLVAFAPRSSAPEPPSTQSTAAASSPQVAEAANAVNTPAPAAPLAGLPPPPAAPSDQPPIPLQQGAPPAAIPPSGTQTAIVIPPPPTPKASDPRAGFRDCQRCPEMVRLPGGTFRMGSNEDPTEMPIRQVRIEPFALARFPVTMGEWSQCVAARACAPLGQGDETAPALNMSWNDAQQYVTWLASSTGQPYRLPSEAEWEYAARGGTTTRYWWGEKVTPNMANCKGCGETYNPSQVTTLGRFPPNPFGLHDMTGNVAQWVADCWTPNYQGAPADGSARTTPNCREHVLRGGSWRNDASYARSASRMHYDTAVRYPMHGLRVARSLP